MKQELIVDLISQRVLLNEINTIIKKQSLNFNDCKSKSECKLSSQNNVILSIRNDKKPSFQIIRKNSTHQTKKNVVIFSLLAVLSLFSFPQIHDLSFVADSTKNTNLNTEYLIQNLKGDTTETWVSWNITPNKELTFTILGASLVSQEKIDQLKDTVLSEKSLQIDNSILHKGIKGTSSTYYMGWQGAMQQASKNPTEMIIPQRFQYVEPNQGVPDITIKLVSQRNGDGYSGYTKSIVQNNQILKSEIIIYNVDELSTSELTTIMRHEFGHALGLAHSTASEELMFPTITTDYPYISPCTLDAITELYNGSQKSEVVCEI